MTKRNKGDLPSWYYCELYKMNYYFHLGWKPDEFQGYAERKYGKSKEDLNHIDGKCMFVEGDTSQGIVIWTRKKTDIFTIAHECVHAANWVLEIRGVDIRDSNAEAMAYLVEFIMRKAIQ